MVVGACSFVPSPASFDTAVGMAPVSVAVRTRGTASEATINPVPSIDPARPKITILTCIRFQNRVLGLCADSSHFPATFGDRHLVKVMNSIYLLSTARGANLSRWLAG